MPIRVTPAPRISAPPEAEIFLALVQLYWIFTAIFMSYAIEAMNVVCALALRGEMPTGGPFREKYISGVKLAQKLSADGKYIPLYQKWRQSEVRAKLLKPWVITGAARVGLTEERCVHMARKVSSRVRQVSNRL